MMSIEHGTQPSSFLKGISCCLLFALVLFLSGCGAQTFLFPWTEPEPLPVGQKIIGTAHTQIGRVYRFGGASPAGGFDCSGLIWWAYRQHGMSVPRVTKDQAKVGTSVSLKQARAGDIVVFRISGRGTGLHTALYAGDGHFIHSPSSGKRVRYDNMSNPYWRSRLRSIRRL